MESFSHFFFLIPIEIYNAVSSEPPLRPSPSVSLAVSAIPLDLPCFWSFSGCTMRVSFAGIRNSLPFSGLIRKLEQQMETVIEVLQPGPLGIIEYKFSAHEIREANATVHRAVANWRANASLEERNHVLEDYIQK